MSDPVVNAEVEDLLSSIRRLVTDVKPSEMPVSTRIKSPERLVLSPEQRVDLQPVAAPEPDVAPLILTESDVVTVDVAEREAEAPTAEPTPDAAAFFNLSEDSIANRHTRLEATIAELEAAVLHTGAEWEPDGSEVNAAPAADPWDGAAKDETPPAVEAEAAIKTEDDTAEEYDDFDDIAQEVASVDEAALRQLISEILQDELRGPVGQRITRNVRKLVRREIYRVLALEELDR